MSANRDPYEPLCDVIAEWLQRHKDLTKAGKKFEGIRTPAVARHEYLRFAGLYGGDRDGTQIYAALNWVRDRDWPHRSDPKSKAQQAFDARVRVGQFELLREWVIVFDERSRHLYTDQDRANVLMAVAKAAQRVADQQQETVAT